MPVEDKPVLKQNIQPTHYGCHNRPEFSSGYWAPDRIYRADGTFESTLVWIEHALTTECVTGRIDNQPLCSGCLRKKT